LGAPGIGGWKSSSSWPRSTRNTLCIEPELSGTLVKRITDKTYHKRMSSTGRRREEERMNPLNRRQHGIFLFVLAWCISVIGSAFGGTTSHIQQSQAFYDKKDYQKALEELDKLDPQMSGAPDARRLKIRILLRLGNPKDALTNYDELMQVLKHEDPSIIREISLGFVLVLTKDMREQMRGAAYTALKEWHSSESIPYLEDGLSDGSGLVRALAAEGLAKLDEGRRSVRFRKALKDPEVRVRVAAAAVLCNLKRSKGCELLLQYAKAPNPDERTSAIRALVD